MKKTLSVLATAALGVSMLAVPAFASGHEGTSYSGTLSPLNGDTASGSASIQVSEDGETMTVDVDASDLELDFVHAMHIHGVFDGDLSDDPADGSFSASACPTLDQDVVNGGDAPDAGSDPDGFLNVLEGAPTYGGVQVSLTTEGDTCADSGLAVERSPAGTSIDDSRDIEIPNSGHVQGRLLEGELDLCSEPWSPEG